MDEFESDLETGILRATSMGVVQKAISRAKRQRSKVITLSPGEHPALAAEIVKEFSRQGWRKIAETKVQISFEEVPLPDTDAEVEAKL